MRWRVEHTVFEITVQNPERCSRGVASATLDGKRVDSQSIPLLEDGGVHQAAVIMGDAAHDRAPPQAGAEAMPSVLAGGPGPVSA